jgi:hypothetical protein
MAHGVGPEFKPQYHRKKETKKRVELHVSLLGSWKKKKAIELLLQSWDDVDDSAQIKIT